MNEHPDAGLGLEDIDVVVVDECFEVKTEPRDDLSLELSLVVNSRTPEVDPNVKVDSQFSYEEGHMMDIDEVLGWKDEIPSVDPTNLPDIENNRVPLHQLRNLHTPEREFGVKQESSRIQGLNGSNTRLNDSYWTDRVVQNLPEEQGKPARRSNKKRFFNVNHEIEANKRSEIITRRKLNLATEVLMRFGDGDYFPSEIHLNKMFKRFGPLMESETEVDRQSGRARVVFKKCSDAEVAHNSAGKFNIFGSVSVDYELNYAPSISYKPLPFSLPQDQPLAC